MILNLLARYWTKVDKRGETDCWIWKGARTVHGYGQIGSGATRHNRATRVLATHVALAIDGRRRPGLDSVAMHACDDPRCVNPKHLRWGTHAENMTDMVEKGRAGCRTTAPIEIDTQEGKERSANAKLNDDAVRYIRSSEKTTIALAAELGVTNQTVSNIRTRRTWRHVE